MGRLGRLFSTPSGGSRSFFAELSQNFLPEPVINYHTMNGPDYETLIEARVRRKLTLEEERMLRDRFAADSGLESRWQGDLALHSLLSRLPNVPVSSNFTSRVLAGLPDNARRSAPRPWFFLRFTWKWAPISALVVLGLFLGWQQHLRALEHRELAKSVATFSQVANMLADHSTSTHATGPSTELPPLPPMELIHDFDAITRLPYAMINVDTELLLALQ